MSNTQYDFPALLMNSFDEARDARNALQKMAENNLLELEDAVIAYKHFNEVRLDQMVNFGATEAIKGTWLGMLVGAIVSIAIKRPSKNGGS